MTKKLILICGILIIVVTNLIIVTKENTLRNGQSVLLKLRPVDPRSLMQGDYMALDFELVSNINKVVSTDSAKNGLVVVTVDKNKIGSFSQIYQGETLNTNQLKLKYRVRLGEIKFGTNAFFFQEGTGSKYESAEYGEFKVSKNGDMILTKLIDSNLKVLE